MEEEPDKKVDPNVLDAIYAAASVC